MLKKSFILAVAVLFLFAFSGLTLAQDTTNVHIKQVSDNNTTLIKQVITNDSDFNIEISFSGFINPGTRIQIGDNDYSLAELTMEDNKSLYSYENSYTINNTGFDNGGLNTGMISQTNGVNAATINVLGGVSIITIAQSP